MQYQGIFFDLDGTLLPMDNDAFIKGYLGLLSKAVAHLGYTPDTMIPTMWKGVAAMVKNDGTCTNFDIFWNYFSNAFGKEVYDHVPTFDAFYADENGFHKAKTLTAPTPLAKQAVELARKKAERIVLATNPFFPRVAVESRLSWAGLSPDDFDLVTTYENSRSCKPNPAYYAEICKKMELDPSQCLMIGNNAKEDIWAAQKAGLSAYLLTDCLIDEEGLLDQGLDCPKGGFAELIELLDRL
jgi:HAD superfamily hydrolase (TIGR01549 family)